MTLQLLLRGLAITFPLMVQTQSFAADNLVSVGYGETSKAAQDDALAALANSIFVNVQSESQLYKNNLGEVTFEASTRASTSLPLIGTSIDCNEKRNKRYVCSAVLNRQRSVAVYGAKTKEVYHAIAILVKKLPNTTGLNLYSTLNSIAALLEQYAKLSTVYFYLSGQTVGLAAPAMSLDDVKQSLQSLEQQSESIALAVKLLSQDMPKESVYIYPPKSIGSREVTEFAHVFRQEWQALVNNVSSPEQATFTLEGEYRIVGDKLRVSYSAMGKDGTVDKFKSVTLTKPAFSHLRYTPLTPNFDELLHQGYAVSDKFRPQIMTNKGSHQLAFHEGESIKLVAKLNAPGYFYFVGHIKNELGEISYLLEQQDASSDRKFIAYIGPDDTNKWVSLGEFIVAAPFGLESLQMVASPSDLIGDLPSYKPRNVNGTDYFVVSSKLTEGVTKTRGLVKKKAKQSNIVAEAVLTFSTFEQGVD